MGLGSGVAVDGSRAGQARTEIGISQEELAARCGISRVTLNRIENGKQRASLQTLEALARELDRSRDWLLGQPENVDPVEQERDRIAAGLALIAASLDGISDITDVLQARAAALADARGRAA